MIKFFKFQDYISAIKDLNKAIELNGDKNEWWIKLAYFIMRNTKGILNNEGACNDWKKATNLGFYLAKKLVREKCN